ncbi:NADH-quinone oxidoreductase subunit N [bacterium]|nr:NADH-quinone oxidoreductase subunit N [bacterium]
MNSFWALSPLLLVVLAALVVLLLEVFLKKETKDYLAYLSSLFLAGCGIILMIFWDKNYSYFDGNFLLDNLALVFSLLLTLATILVILISIKYISLQGANYGEYYALLLFALSGMLIMVSSQSLLIIFLGLEILSISSYSLAGLRRENPESSEAAIKYFLLGSFATAFLVYGLALMYGSTHSLEISSIIRFLTTGTHLNLMLLVGLGLIIIGFAFKIALVPFHMWTPDVYQGSPTPVTAFFSVGPKVVGFAVLLRIFHFYWETAFHTQTLMTALWVISVLTMVVGNLIALRQTNVKRILAYSSIAHAGYLLIALIAQDPTSLIFYLAVYLFMNIGAFTAVTSLGRKGKEYVELNDYSGIGFKYPWIGATFAVFLFSLAGFPPTGGFLAKFFVFASAVRKGFTPLVIIAVIASLISVFYYLRIIVTMYMKEPSPSMQILTRNPVLFSVLFLCLYGVLQLGIYPGNVLGFIRQAVAAMPLL